MAYFEQIHDYTIEDEIAKEMRENALTRSNCLKKFSEISNLYQDYIETGKIDEELRQKIISLAGAFRQGLRR